MAKDVEKDWWSRVFDDGPAAKRGCFLTLGFAALLVFGYAMYPRSASDVQEIEGSTIALSPMQTADICKAGIGKLFGQSPNTMTVETLSDETIRISYRRSSDDTLWKNDCMLVGNRIMWRAVDAFPGSGVGRWRDHPADGVLTYKIDDGRIEVTETFLR